MILALILIMEVTFWILLGLGLLLRYPLRRPRLGLTMFALTPLVDLTLLGLVVVDLRGGAIPSWQHSMAAFYIGFSLMFGHAMITWADRQYRIRFRGESIPRPRSTTPVADEWRSFAKAVGAVGIAVVALEIVIALADSASATQLRGAWVTAGVILVIWLLTGPVWASISAQIQPRSRARV
ncbi:hypothetical protein [Corynebacterium sp.]|uniref:hypothetical protein n=1 Tax=Corynebacterium sp. TaxID=1720 RepID=UPI0026DF3144|nr:hypothetical protein [Corynebacterium sp.]MDO5512219.1 hypothetical protein [Corynebacterium sp.]